MAVFGFFKKGFDPEVYERELTTLTESMLTTQQQMGLLRRRYRDVRRVWVQWLVMIYVVMTAYNWMQIPATTTGKNKIQRYFKGLLQRQLVVVLVYPVALWATLKVIRWLFEYLIRRRERRLKLLQNKHTAKIDELKKITNFNTTSKLLKKYDAEPEVVPQQRKSTANPNQRVATPQAHASGVVPATANVRQRNPTEEKIRLQLNLDIDVPQGEYRSPLPLPPAPGSGPGLQQQQHQQQDTAVDDIIQRHLQEKQKQRLWGDRVLDMLLGLEHNELVENRYALVCHNCYAHNGLAPPGCTNPLQVKYVCYKCGALNGDFGAISQGLGSDAVNGNGTGNASDAHVADSHINKFNDDIGKPEGERSS